VAEARYWRALALSLGLDPDTPIDDLLLVERVVDEYGRTLGVQPARAVTKELDRCRRWVEEEQRKAATRAEAQRPVPRG